MTTKNLPIDAWPAGAATVVLHDAEGHELERVALQRDDGGLRFDATHTAVQRTASVQLLDDAGRVLGESLAKHGEQR